MAAVYELLSFALFLYATVPVQETFPFCKEYRNGKIEEDSI